MFDAIYYLAVVAMLAIVVFGLLFAVQKQLADGGGLQSIGFLRPRPGRRLSIVEHVHLDGKRRLVLVRRDEVEHLIMTGGPVDVVIETGIVPQSPPRTSAIEEDLAGLTDEPFPRDPPIP